MVDEATEGPCCLAEGEAGERSETVAAVPTTTFRVKSSKYCYSRRTERTQGFAPHFIRVVTPLCRAVLGKQLRPISAVSGGYSLPKERSSCSHITQTMCPLSLNA